MKWFLRARRRKVILGVATACVLVVGFIAFRAGRAVFIGKSWYDQIRYLIENGMTIGEAPAYEAFATAFIEIFFADNPELQEQVKAIVRKRLREEPQLYFGEVTGILVTYHTDKDGSITDVVFHAIGDFPVGRRKPGFHPGGYFFQHLDRDLWNYGNKLVSLLGRDIVFSALDEATRSRHQELMEALMSGEIMPLVERLDRPLHYVAIFPNPVNLVPAQLRRHIRSAIVKGYLSPYKGETEIVALTQSEPSARYAATVLGDMKLLITLLLKTRWHGVERETPWGIVRNPWWAYEMVQTLERTEQESRDNAVRFYAKYERVMVNALLKAVERMSRDIAAMELTLARKEDPRVADAKLTAKKPLHYWSEAHQWGPDWPFPPAQPVGAEASQSAEITAPAEAEGSTSSPVTEPQAAESPQVSSTPAE